MCLCMQLLRYLSFNISRSVFSFDYHPHANIHRIRPPVPSREPQPPREGGSAASCSPQTCFNGDLNCVASSDPPETHTQTHQTAHRTADMSVVFLRTCPFPTSLNRQFLDFHFFVRVLPSASTSLLLYSALVAISCKFAADRTPPFYVPVFLFRLELTSIFLRLLAY